MGWRLHVTRAEMFVLCKKKLEPARAGQPARYGTELFRLGSSTAPYSTRQASDNDNSPKFGPRRCVSPKWGARRRPVLSVQYPHNFPVTALLSCKTPLLC